MNRFLRCLLAYFLFTFALQAAAAQTAPYQILSTDLPPFTIEAGPDAPGALGEIVKELSARLGVSAPIQFVPWPRAQMLAQRDAGVLILPLTRTPEREAHYRWMVKLYQQQFVFIARRNQGIDVQSLAKLRTMHVVVLRDSPNVSQLRSRNFEHIIEATTADEMTRMLKLGMVDAIYGGDVINLHVLAHNGIAKEALDVSNPLETGEIWLGGSLDFSQQDADKWQKAMQQLKADGGYQRILLKYHLAE